MTKICELKPVNGQGQKSFYGKAEVIIGNGFEVLISYNTPIMGKTKTGELVRYWTGWTATTGKHIKAFCGLNKKGFEALPVAKTPGVNIEVEF